MVFKFVGDDNNEVPFRGIDLQPSAHTIRPLNDNYFTEQHHRDLTDDHHLHHQSHLLRYTYHPTHDVIRMEIEKEKIRNEIIMSELVHLRTLESNERGGIVQQSLPFYSYGTRAQGRFVEEKISVSAEEEKVPIVMYQSGQIHRLSFPRRATPDPNISGSKRKAVSTLENDAKPKKTIRRTWSCDLCQVNMTSAQCLKQHLEGRKHRFKKNR